jgi:hypothetical protein
MNREPAPCSTCARFRKDRCEGYEKPRRADDTNEACPLFVPRKAQRASAGTTRKPAETRMDAVSHRSAGQQPRKANETISRASAPSVPAVAGTTTT